ncbi:hypothetical protein [Humibacter sp.]|uniref:hypothetical protein n=1 Tax=Humibacter sp. TaxID=1940291 RepID=UPI003F7D8369
MGDKNVKAALWAAIRLDLSKGAERLLLTAARIIRDPEPGKLQALTWWASRAETAEYANLSERAVDRAWAELVQLKLATRTVKGAPGQAANYTLALGVDGMSQHVANVRQKRRMKGANLSHEWRESVAPKSPIEVPYGDTPINDHASRGRARVTGHQLTTAEDYLRLSGMDDHAIADELATLESLSSQERYDAIGYHRDMAMAYLGRWGADALTAEDYAQLSPRGRELHDAAVAREAALA